jgi:hypothetical protein
MIEGILALLELLVGLLGLLELFAWPCKLVDKLFGEGE